MCTSTSTSTSSNVFTKEDTIRYPYYLFMNTHTIPYLQRHSVLASTCNFKGDHIVSIAEFYGYLGDIREMTRTNQLGILPRGIPPYAKRLYFQNQRTRWAFKKLLHLYRVHTAPNKIGNTECLECEPIQYNPHKSPRRILSLWDGHSNRMYMFRLNDILGIFRAQILEDEIHHPRNPYTNLPFTIQQIRVIHEFLYANMDRLTPEDSPILTYTRWRSVHITYNHTNQSPRQRAHFQLESEPTPGGPTPLIASLLLDKMLMTKHIWDDKKQYADELKNECLAQLRHESVSDIPPVPKTKLGLYIHNTIQYSSSPGDTFHEWGDSNRVYHMVIPRENRTSDG